MASSFQIDGEEKENGDYACHCGLEQAYPPSSDGQAILNGRVFVALRTTASIPAYVVGNSNWLGNRTLPPPPASRQEWCYP